MKLIPMFSMPFLYIYIYISYSILYHTYVILYCIYSILTSKYQINIFLQNRPSNQGCYFWGKHSFFSNLIFLKFDKNPGARTQFDKNPDGLPWYAMPRHTMAWRGRSCHAVTCHGLHWAAKPSCKRRNRCLLKHS